MPANKNQVVQQAVVLTDPPQNLSQTTKALALYNESGAPLTGRDAVYAPVVVAGAIGTAAKTTTTPEPVANTLVPIRFTNGNTAAAPTVAFNGGTARVVHLGGSTPAAAECTLAANGVALFWFDGSILHQVGVYS
jgi:hypothetical protein